MTTDFDASAVGASIEHIYGAQTIDYSLDELIVLCLVRDGESHIRSFIDHYTSLGVKQIIFLDNGSKDDTIEIACSYPNTTVLQSRLDFKYYKFAMKQYLFKRFGKERWALCADVDELFDYPFSSQVKLNALLQYLNTHAYTAVVTYMLDMFSDHSLQEWSELKSQVLRDVYKFYDLSNIDRLDFLEFCPNNTISNTDIANYRGGIRETLFGTYDRITKTPLIYGTKKIKPIHNSTHKVEGAFIADITAVFYHYKFVDNFNELVKRVVAEENYYNNSEKYKKILAFLQSEPNLQVMQQTSQELKSVNDLVKNQFLVVSDEYRKFANSQATISRVEKTTEPVTA